MAVDMDKVRARFRDLQDQRSPYEARYRDLARYILPDSGRFEASSTQSAKAGGPVDHSFTMPLRLTPRGL